MKLYHFVSSSAVLLSAWLMLTFFIDVSPLQYQQQRKGNAVHAANHAPVKQSAIPQTGMPEGSREIAAASDHRF